MALISPEDQNQLRTEFLQMTRRVRLLFFTQALDGESCLQTRQILDELTPLSDRIVVDEVNFVLEPDRAKLYGIDRVPAIAVAYEDPDAASPLQDSRIRFLGTPAGYEFIPLVQAILLVGGGASRLSALSRERLAAVDRPMTMQVFSTPT